jgi:DNA-binding transcriptional regulator GbsR (MarR family)
MHFDNVFMPQFEKEVKDSKENFDKTIKKANEIVKLNEDFAKEIIDKINYELVWWSKVDATNKKNEEYVLQIYKPLKRLVSKYNEKKDGK